MIEFEITCQKRKMLETEEKKLQQQKTKENKYKAKRVI